MILGRSKVGKAVFAGRDFVKGEMIIEFTGPLLKKKDLPKRLKPEDDRYVQISKDEFMGASDDFDDYINHSCDPNSGLKEIKGKLILFTIKDIKKGEEITWDYSTTMAEDDWVMACKCGGPNCRKKIGDFKDLPKDLQQKYIQLGIVPQFALDEA